MGRHWICKKYNDSWVFRLPFIVVLDAVAMAMTYAVIRANMPGMASGIVVLLMISGLAIYASWLVVPPLPRMKDCDLLG